MNIPVHWRPWAAKKLILDLESRLREKGKNEARLQDQLSSQDNRIETLLDEAASHHAAVATHATAVERHRKGMAALISWIQAAHRIGPAPAGSIQEVLQKSQNPQTQK